MKRLLSVFLAIAVSQAAGAPARESGKQPNIIFIMVDDMGHADIGPYGQKQIKTPHLDRMAAEGIKFTAAYAGASVCAPSRSVLMTGQHLGHTRVRGNSARSGGVKDHNGTSRIPLEPEDVTVAQVLKKNGYVTGMTGKWGLGEPGSTGEPDLKGFDEWFGFLNQNHAHTHYPDYLWRNREKVTIDKNVGGKRGQHTHELFTNFALDFVRRRSREPFFLYLAYTLPHQEYAVPGIAAAYAGKPWTDDEKIFATMIDMIDRDTGRLLDLLKELRIDDNTIVFFCSDNGGWKRYDGRFDSNRGLRGVKGDIYEGGLRTPMLVRWPGKTPKGATSDLPWMFADVLPTLAAVAGGAAVPAAVDGVSVLPSILGQRQNLDRMLYWEQYGGQFLQAARWGKWKGIRAALDNGTFELYDLSIDSEEKRNVAKANPDVVKKISAFMDAAHTPSPLYSKVATAGNKAPKKKLPPKK